MRGTAGGCWGKWKADSYGMTSRREVLELVESQHLSCGVMVSGWLVFGVLFLIAGGAAGVDQVRGGDGGEGFLLGFGVNAPGAGEGWKGDGLAGVEGLHDAFEDTDVGEAFFAIGLDFEVIEDAVREILEFAAEVVGVLEGLG